MRRLLVVLLAASVLFIQAASVAILVGQFDAAERDGRKKLPQAYGVEFTLSSSANLPAPKSATRLLVGAATRNGVNVLRLVTGISSDNRSSTSFFIVEGRSTTHLLDGLRLDSGRWPTVSELAKSDRFASSNPAVGASQVGVIADLLHDDDVSVRPLAQAFDYVPVAGSYFVEGDHSKRVAFLKDVAAGLGDPTVTPNSLLANGNSNHLVAQSSGFETSIASVVGALAFTLLLVTYLQVADAKRIGVMRMLGLRLRDQWSNSIGRWLLGITIAGAIVCVVGLFSVADITMSLAIRGVVQVVATVALILCLSIAATAISRRIPLSDALKNRRPVGGLFIIGGIVKTVAAAVFIVTIAGLFNSLSVAAAEQKRMDAWAKISDYGIFYPKSVGDDVQELQSGQPGSTIAEVYDLYPALDKAGALFIDLTGIRGPQPPPGAHDYTSIAVNLNYLRQYPIKSATGSNISVTNDDTNWVVLVPERYRESEVAIRDYFQHQRTGEGTSKGAIGAELAVLGRQAPPRLAKQKVEIRWVQDNQMISILSTEYPKNGSGAIPIPIVEVLTEANSLGIDRANAFSGEADSAMKVKLIAPGQTAETYAKLKPELVALHLDDNLTNLVTPSEVIGSQLVALRDGIRNTLISAGLSLLIMILLGAQNATLALDRFGRSTAVKRWLGYSFALRHRPSLLAIAATWLAQVILAVLVLGSGAAPFNNAPLASSATLIGIGTMLGIEVVLAAVVLMFTERRRTLAALKGDE